MKSFFRGTAEILKLQLAVTPTRQSTCRDWPTLSWPCSTHGRFGKCTPTFSTGSGLNTDLQVNRGLDWREVVFSFSSYWVILCMAGIWFLYRVEISHLSTPFPAAFIPPGLGVCFFGLFWLAGSQIGWLGIFFSVTIRLIWLDFLILK